MATRLGGAHTHTHTHRNCSEEEREDAQGEDYKLLGSEAVSCCVFVALVVLDFNVRAAGLCLILASWRV